MVSAPAVARRRPPAVVIGDGVIGLSTAYALARAGADCTLIGARRAGMASDAAAGLLLPDLAHLPEKVRPFFAASLAAYPEFIASLREFDPALALIRGANDASSEFGGVHTFRAHDGAIDNVRLVAALRSAVSARSSVELIADDPVVRIDLHSHRVAVTTRSGHELDSERIVLAAGAWAPQIDGLPTRLPVRPLKGQMLALGAAPLDVPLIGDDVYLVPRGGETLVGATVEDAGFDLAINRSAIDAMRQAAVHLCPPLASAPITRTWAGIRPASPDMLPILGADPSDARLIYACGHSKNGILLAPATGAAIARLAAGLDAEAELEPFGIARFARAHEQTVNNPASRFCQVTE